MRQLAVYLTSSEIDARLRSLEQQVSALLGEVRALTVELETLRGVTHERV